MAEDELKQLQDKVKQLNDDVRKEYEGELERLLVSGDLPLFIEALANVLLVRAEEWEVRKPVLVLLDGQSIELSGGGSKAIHIRWLASELNKLSDHRHTNSIGIF